MQTIKIKYSISSQEDQLLLNNYIRQYNNVYRVAFNRYQNELSNQLTKFPRLNNINLLDTWFIQSAIFEAKSLYSLTNKNKVIFGGKKNFFNRLKGLITKEQYKQNRLSPLTSYGEKASGTKSVHGNRKFKLSEDISYITLKLKDRKIQLNLPNKLHQNIKTQLINIYKHQLLDDIAITYKVDLNYVYIQFDEELVLQKKQKLVQIKNRVLAVDLNPNYIGWSIVDWKSENQFNVIKSGIYSIKELNDIDFSLKGKGYSSNSKERICLSNKRNYETLQITKNIINKAIYYKCQIVSIEDLKITSDDKNKGKKFNKLVNNLWNRNALVNNLTKRCKIFNIKLLKVKPEYSSFIGNFLYRSLNLPDMILASIELGRRAYEFYNQYITKTKETKKNIVQPDLNLFNDLVIKSLEEFNIQREQFKDLKELYYIFKKSKMMYRLSIDQFNLQFSRLFSTKSYVGQFCL